MAIAKAAAVITSLLDDTKLSNADKRRVLDIVAGGYKGKVVSTVEKFSFSGTAAQSSGNSQQSGSAPKKADKLSKDPGHAAVSKKGQAPPNPVKRHPDFVKLSNARLGVVDELKKLNPITQVVEHAAKKKQMQDLEIAMATFKIQHGRSSVPPVVNNAEARSTRKSPRALRALTRLKKDISLTNLSSTIKNRGFYRFAIHEATNRLLRYFVDFKTKKELYLNFLNLAVIAQTNGYCTDLSKLTVSYRKLQLRYRPLSW